MEGFQGSRRLQGWPGSRKNYDILSPMTSSTLNPLLDSGKHLGPHRIVGSPHGPKVWGLGFRAHLLMGKGATWLGCRDKGNEGFWG